MSTSRCSAVTITLLAHKSAAACGRQGILGRIPGAHGNGVGAGSLEGACSQVVLPGLRGRIVAELVAGVRLADRV